MAWKPACLLHRMRLPATPVRLRRRASVWGTLQSCGEDLQQLAVQSGVGRGPGIKRANPSFDSDRILGPVDPALFFFNQWGIGRFGLILRPCDQAPLFEQPERLIYSFGPEPSALVV